MAEYYGDHWFVYTRISQQCKSNTFETVYENEKGKFEYIANAALALFRKRAFVIFEELYEKPFAFKALTKERRKELEELVKYILTLTGKDGRDDAPHIQFHMEDLVLDYLDGTLKRELDAFESLTKRQYAKLEVFVKK